MAMNRTSARRSRANRRERREISPATKKALLAGVAGVTVLAGAYWMFDWLMTPPKPQLDVAQPQDVAAYLGHHRGFSHLPIVDREKFLYDVIERYKTPEQVEAMNRALGQLSFSERQQFLDGAFEIGKEKFMQASEDYLRTPKAQRRKFVDKALNDFEHLRSRLAGSGGPPGAPGGGPSLASPFRNHIPTKSDQWTKMIVERTSPSERSKAKPFLDDLSQRIDQKRHSRPG